MNTATLIFKNSLIGLFAFRKEDKSSLFFTPFFMRNLRLDLKSLLSDLNDFSRWCGHKKKKSEYCVLWKLYSSQISMQLTPFYKH